MSPPPSKVGSEKDLQSATTTLNLRKSANIGTMPHAIAVPMPATTKMGGHLEDGRDIRKMGGRSRRRGGKSIRTRSSPTLEDHVGEHLRSDAAEQATITRANHMFPVSWQGVEFVG